MYKFGGVLLEWNIGEPARKYISGSAKYKDLRPFIYSEPYSDVKNVGEQRNLIKSRANYIKIKMLEGKFSPCPITIGTRDPHRNNIVVDTNSKTATVTVNNNELLPVLDGFHRITALDFIRSSGDAVMKDIVDNLYITYLLYLDGSPRSDFVNLQDRAPVSKDHLLSIKISDNLIDKKTALYFKVAKQTAEILNKKNDNCFHNLIRFDSKSGPLPLSLNSLCRKSASEIAFSLYGGAKIAITHKKDAKWIANCILTAYRAIKRDKISKNALSPANVICPKPEGTRAGSTFIIAIGNMLAARLMLEEKDEPSDEDLKKLVRAVEKTLIVASKGNTSADSKRNLLGLFAREFFSDMQEYVNGPDDEDLDTDTSIMFHDDIPVTLIILLSSSTFNVRKLVTKKTKCNV